MTYRNSMRPILTALGKAMVFLVLMMGLVSASSPLRAQTLSGAEDVPQELRMVLYASILHIRDVEDAGGYSWPVRLTDQAKAGLRDPLGGLQGFSVHQIDIMDVAEVAGSPGLFDVKFLLAMRDDFGRTYLSDVNVQYFHSNKGPMVLKSEVIPVITPQPKFRFYVVPARDLESVLASSPSAVGFLSAVVTHAIEPSLLNAVTAKGGEFIVVGLNQFRSPPGDEIRLAVDADPASPKGFSEGAVVLNFDGWQVGVLPLRIAPNAPASTVKAFFRSVITARPPHTVASFTIGGDTAPTQGQAVPQASSSRLMLNNADDARKVQQRLKELGFYAGGVDGQWGASSRRALRQFKSMNGLEDTPIWDDETQSLLFPN